MNSFALFTCHTCACLSVYSDMSYINLISIVSVFYTYEQGCCTVNGRLETPQLSGEIEVDLRCIQKTNGRQKNCFLHLYVKVLSNTNTYSYFGFGLLFVWKTFVKVNEDNKDVIDDYDDDDINDNDVDRMMMIWSIMMIKF